MACLGGDLDPSLDVSLEHEDNYTVQWRTVSVDGHPIEGSYTFTYAPEGAAAATEATPGTEEEAGHSDGEEAHNDDATAEATPEAEGASDPETVDSAPASQEERTGTGMIIGIAAVVIVLAAAAAYLLGRKNSAKNV
ncbi:copper resistance protein CopC [Arthrobacter sp. HLT1-21]